MRHRAAALACVLFAISLASCGGGGGGGSESPPPPPPPPSANYTIGGTVSGLQGGSVTLQLNGAVTLVVSANGSFAFTGTVPAGGPYSVAVSQEPSDPAQPCVVTQGSGTASGNVTNIAVTCTGQLVGGTVTGLSGDGLKLSLNGGEGLVTVNGDGSFRFPVTLPSGASYSIGMAAPPYPVQRCNATPALGTVSGNVSVQVSCSAIVHPGALVTFEYGGTPNLGQPPFSGALTGRVSTFTAQGAAMAIQAGARAALPQMMFTQTSYKSTPTVEVGGEYFFYSYVTTSASSSGNGAYGGIAATYVSAGARYASVVPGGPFMMAGTSPNCGGSIEVHPSQRLLFAPCNSPVGFSVFAINQDGSLTRLNASPMLSSLGTSTNFLIHPNGRFLISLHEGVNQQQDVHISAIDTTTGELTDLMSVRSPGINSSLALSADGTHLYVGSGISGVLRIDPRTGAMTRVTGAQTFIDAAGERAISQPGGHVHFFEGGGRPIGYFKDPQTRALREVFRGTSAGTATFDVTGRFVYLSSVSSPGRILRGYSIGADGTMTPVPDSDTYYPRPEVQILADPSGRSLYVLTDDKRLYQFDIDRGTGMLKRAAHVHSYVPGQTTRIAAIPMTSTPEYRSTGAIALGNGELRGLIVDEVQGSLGLAPGSAAVVAPDARSLAIDQSRRFVYVANTSLASIAGFNRAADGGLSPMTNGPFANFGPDLELAMDPFGDLLWSTSLASSFVSGSRLDANADNGALIRVTGYPVTQPDRIVAHPMLNSFFIASANQNTVVPISWVPGGNFDRETDNTAFPRPTMGTSPIDMEMDPMGKWLFVLHYVSQTVTTMRTSYDTVRGVASVEYIGDGGSVNTPAEPRALTVDPDGRYVYASSFATSSVAVFRVDALTGRLTEITGSPFPVGGHPSDMEVSAGGRLLLIAFPGDGVVSAFGRNPETGSLTAAPLSSVNTGNAPDRIALTRERFN